MDVRRILAILTLDQTAVRRTLPAQDPLDERRIAELSQIAQIWISFAAAALH
jgi:hypothetical protein